jgi:hypothetical protein
VLVFHRKAQGLNQMQGAACVGCQANDVARVGRNFGMDEDDVKHSRIVPHAYCVGLIYAVLALLFVWLGVLLGAG